MAYLFHLGLLFERAWHKEPFCSCSQDTRQLCSLKEQHVQLWDPRDLTHFDQIKISDINRSYIWGKKIILVP